MTAQAIAVRPRRRPAHRIPIAIGILCAGLRRGRTAIACAVIALAATLSARASARREFAMTASPWSTQSHVTAYYIGRSTPVVQRLLGQLKQAHPTFPPRT